MDTNIRRREAPQNTQLEIKKKWVESKYVPKNKLYPGAAPGRRVGKTTAIALRLISIAIATPNNWYVVKDHLTTYAADYLLLQIIRDMVEELELKFFSWKIDASGKCYIRFDIFEVQA